MSEEHEGRFQAQYVYFGGPRDGQLFEMGPGALVPHIVEIRGVDDGYYAVNDALCRFEWRSGRAS